MSSALLRSREDSLRQPAEFRERDPGAELPAVTLQAASVLAVIAAFCLPFSADLAHPLGRPLSHLFNLAVLGLVVLWVVACPGGWRVVPRSCRLFLGIVWIHTVIYYTAANPGAFTWQPQVVDLGFAHAVRDSVASRAFKLILYPCYMLALAGLLRSPRQWVSVAAGMLAGHLLLLMANNPLVNLAAGVRYTGGYANPNAYGEIAYLLIATGGLVAVFDRSRSRLLGLALVALGVTGALLSLSRAVLVAIAAAVVFLTILGRARYRVGLAVALFPIVVLVLVAPDILRDQLQSRTSNMGDNVRLLIWVSYLQSLPEYLWTGVGLGRELTVLKSGILYDRVWNPHNTYLKAFVTFGIAGFAAVIILVAGAVRDLWTRYRRSPGTRADAWLLAGAVFGYAFMMFFADRLENRAIWQLLGMVYAMMYDGPQQVTSPSMDRMTVSHA